MNENADRILSELEARLRAMHSRFERSRDPHERARLATSIKVLERERRAYSAVEFPWD